MSTKYSVVSLLVIGLLLSSVVATASATTPSKEQLKQPTPLPNSLASTQTTDVKQESPAGALVKVVSKSTLALNALAYQPKRWKPTSYMGGPHRRCQKHYRSRRRYSSSRMG